MRLFGLFGAKPETPSEAGGVAVDSWPPNKICAHAQRLIDSGNLAGAFEALQTGITAHPNSQEIKALYEQVQKHRIKEQVASLTATIRSHPDPASYAALVDAYIADGDSITARQLCNQGIERYPDDPDLCLRMGQLWFDLFKEGAIAKNAHFALTSLARCIEKDPRNRKAHETLIRLFTLIGAPTRALREFGGFLPSGEMHSLFDRIVAQLSLPDEDLDALLRDFERRREPGAAPSALPSVATLPRPADALLKDVITGLAGAKGHLATAVIDPNGAPVETQISNDLDGKVIAEVVDTLSEVAKSCCARMGIGAFEEEKIQGPNGTTFIKAVGNLTLFVLMDKKARAHEVAGHLAKLSSSP